MRPNANPLNRRLRFRKRTQMLQETAHIRDRHELASGHLRDLGKDIETRETSLPLSIESLHGEIRLDCRPGLRAARDEPVVSGLSRGERSDEQSPGIFVTGLQAYGLRLFPRAKEPARPPSLPREDRPRHRARFALSETTSPARGRSGA